MVNWYFSPYKMKIKYLSRFWSELLLLFRFTHIIFKLPLSSTCSTKILPFDYTKSILCRTAMRVVDLNVNNSNRKLHLNNVATFNVYKLVRIIIIASHNGGEWPDELARNAHSTLFLRRPTTTTSILVPFFRRKFDCEYVRRSKSRSASDPRTLASVWLRVIPILHKATAYFPILFNYKRIYCAEEK